MADAEVERLQVGIKLFIPSPEYLDLTQWKWFAFLVNSSYSMPVD